MKIEKSFFQLSRFLPLFSLFSLMTIGLIYLHYSYPNAIKLIDVLLILVILWSIVGIIVGIAKSRKVILTDEGVTYKSRNEIFHIAWQAVKSWGGFAVNRYFDKQLDNNQLENFKTNIWGAKMLYVSTKINFTPTKAENISENFISFPYQKDLLVLLHRKLTNTKNE